MSIVHRIVRFGLVLSVLTACGTAAPEPPALGEQAPNFSLPTLDGDTAQLEDYRGNVVIVNFWATWCAPCEQETPRFVGWFEQHQDDGLQLLGVNTLYQDSRAAVEEFVHDKAVSYPMLLDETGDVSKQWEARLLPRSYVIDHEGVVRYVRIGELTDADFTAHVQPLLDQMRR